MNLLDTFPEKQRVAFEATLASYEGVTREGRLRAHIEHMVALEKKSSQATGSIDDRLTTHRYFYFPGEHDLENIPNCFESALEIYFAMLILAPEKRPQLLAVNHGVRGVHMLPVFQEGGHLHVLDSRYDLVGPITFNGKKLHGKNSQGESTSYSFSEIHFVNPDELADLINVLRSPKGIIDFFSYSGQIIERRPQDPYPAEVFGYVTDGTFVGETRIATTSVPFAKRETLSSQGTQSASWVMYVLDNWRELVGERTICSWNPEEKHPVLSIARAKSLPRDMQIGLAAHHLYIGSLLAKRTKTHSSWRNTFMFGERITSKFVEEHYETFKELFSMAAEKSSHYLIRMVDYVIYRQGLQPLIVESGAKTPRGFRQKRGYTLSDSIKTNAGYYRTVCPVFKEGIMKRVQAEVAKHFVAT
ncbi:MAG: hypothetical protein H6502_04105 [Candidatus Woesearchaeota archaeon]|nr:MAG: hypothetical protein H6502_04105 [Candidatus Woesearchaeota archaeon]